MLSTQSPSSIQRRTILHRRQNSTPAAFEGPTVRPLPTNLRQQRQHRSGMSLDLRGLNLETKVESPLLPTGDSTVSNTNLGQPQQHYMQVAQPHSQPQPGLQDAFVPSPVQQSLPSPRTPHRSLNRDRSPHHLSQTPQQFPQSPTKPPSEEEVKQLQRHIQSVYGSYAQVFINILPTPAATPQKPSRLVNQISAEPLPALMSPNFGDMTTVNLEPTPSAMTFDFENPDADVGYDSSSYYTSDALSPSPASSPRQKSLQASLEDIKEDVAQEMTFSQQPTLLPSAMEPNGMGLPSFMPVSEPPRAPLPIELELNATLEYTGISAEEVQRYISEQDPSTGKWTCLYPDCSKVFGRKENIRSHVQTHLGDRQYRCNGCGKCFVRQHDLKRHAKIHSGVKSYKCPCGAGFARQDALTRHRQRGMCVGGFPDAVRRPAKRGRPKKNRPDMDERVSKAAKTRRALASAASSMSAGSPHSDSSSAGNSPPALDEYENPGLQKLLSGFCNFDDSMNAVSDPFASYSTSSSFDNSADIQPRNLEAPLSFANNIVASPTTKQDLSQPTHTPPMSPADHISVTNCSTPAPSNSQRNPITISPTTDSFQHVDPALKAPSTPSQSSIHSNPFSTPPTSPAEPKDPLDEIDMFGTMTDGSQFELEMKAMGESDYSVGLGGLETGIGGSGYEFLNFDL